MKKWKMTMATGAVIFVISACGQTENTEARHLTIEKITDTDSAESAESGKPVIDKEGEPDNFSDEYDDAPADESAKRGNTNLTEISVGEGQEAAAEVREEAFADAQNALYEAFLKNETGAANPYVEGMNLTVMDDKKYESEFEDVWKKYAYVDVNDDGNPELIFKICSNPSELMYILGIYDDELVCFDVFETHTRNIAFGVYDYGYVWETRDYDGFEMTFYTYTVEGQPMEVRRFTEENRADIAAYEGEDVEWIDWQSNTPQ